MPTTRRAGETFTALLLVALFVTACVRAPGVSIGELDASSPDLATQTPAKEDCYDISIEASNAPPSLEAVRQGATDVVEGIFGGYEDAKWNTPDGHRPTREEVQDSARLIRPMKIEFVANLRGDATAIARAIARGGTLGCDSVTYSDDVALENGQPYVFFLMPVNDSKNELSQALLAFASWPVSKDGKVDVPGSGPMAVAELEAALENGLKPAVPPSPGEPEETTP